jgi:hypothetical protein
MRAVHLVFLVEEPSAEAFLEVLLPRVLPADCSFEIHAFGGKADFLKKLPQRLRAYAEFLPQDWRLIVLVDRDDDDCHQLKARLQEIATDARLRTPGSQGHQPWQVVNRIAIEELEAWYFGDWQAVCAAFAGVSPGIVRKAPYRDPDGIQGGTWEAFLRILQKHRHYRGGLRKIEAAREVARHVDADRSTSPSFRHLYAVIQQAVTDTEA